MVGSRKKTCVIINLLLLENETLKISFADLKAQYDSIKDEINQAIQYVTAEKYGLTLVSFDTDFDRTERGRKTPAEIIDK